MNINAYGYVAPEIIIYVVMLDGYCDVMRLAHIFMELSTIGNNILLHQQVMQSSEVKVNKKF
jgi:hypothetical protein